MKQVNINKLSEKSVLTISLRLSNQFKFRMLLFKYLIKLAVIIIGCKLEYDKSELELAIGEINDNTKVGTLDFKSGLYHSLDILEKHFPELKTK